MESSVTRLLVATKLLLESLTQWSQGRESETNVSRIYVRLGNDFNAALSAFISANVDMTDLYSVPADLRVCLEACLSEPASPDALERHLPRIREIIIRLLQGLKAKQLHYKQLQMEPQRAAPQPEPAAPAPQRVTTHASNTLYSLRPPPLQGPRPPLSRRASPQIPRAVQDPPETPIPGGFEVSSASLSSKSVPATPQRARSSAPNETPVTVPARFSPEKHGTGEDISNRLRKSDALERRASKRFSAYAFNRMGVGSGLLAALGSTPPASSPRSEKRTPQGSLSSVSELQQAPSILTASPTRASGPSKESPSLPTDESLSLPVDSVPPVQAQATGASAMSKESVEAASKSSQPPSTGATMELFLQVGRQTKKVTVPIDAAQADRGLSLGTLRMLFVDQFSYSSGISDFPDIYIKDATTGVAYQLENLDDIQPKSILTLNIEPLDQVKEHVDLAIAALSRELREIKSLVQASPRGALERNRSLSGVHAPATPISDKAFQEAGHRMSSLVAPTGSEPLPATTYTGELKAHYEALQQLRHDFAILRQVHDEGERDIHSTLAAIRERVKEMNTVVALGPSTGRNLIESGKAKLDVQSQQVLTSVEDLQDVIEDLKLDVSHRGVKPKAAELRRITTDIATTTKRLDELERFIQTVRPYWKKTWESELQLIVDEQEFLNYQEGLLVDLQQDHKALQDVFGNIQQVVRLRDVGMAQGNDPGRGPRYVPPPPDEEHQGLPSVMAEVRTQSIDHERRLRALQAAERSREKAKAGRTDEFANELAGFVDGKALRRTGGHLEAERVRQKRDQTTLRAMLHGQGSSSS
ncbi:Bud site selection protein 6 [Malassezia equina]|uniref:Bud site selection protein 6 n=1 Tax=Malassezia equina TaxID=1381935 RepID=A0AAF0J3X8_9BASI|nr:Bud site selection protein 6 [Malassezia equina]